MINKYAYILLISYIIPGGTFTDFMKQCIQINIFQEVHYHYGKSPQIAPTMKVGEKA